MERRVYRSLDRPVAFFGVRGRYTTWLAMGLGGDLVLSLVVGMMTVGMIGVVLFVAGAIAIYLYIISFQERMSDRELDRKLNGRRLASCIRRKPVCIRRILSEGNDRKY